MNIMHLLHCHLVQEIDYLWDRLSPPGQVNLRPLSNKETTLPGVVSSFPLSGGSLGKRAKSRPPCLRTLSSETTSRRPMQTDIPRACDGPTTPGMWGLNTTEPANSMKLGDRGIFY